MKQRKRSQCIATIFISMSICMAAYTAKGVVAEENNDIENLTIKAQVNESIQENESIEEDQSIGDELTVESDTAEGEVERGISIALSTIAEGAEIYYSLNDYETEVTTTSGIRYTGPIVLDEDLFIQAIAYKEGVTGDVSRFNYIIKEEDPILKAAITADPKPGKVKRGVAITLSSNIKEAEIYYTLNEEETNVTTSSSIKYEEPIVIEKDTIIRAISYKDGKSSSVRTFKYEVEGLGAIVATPESGKVKKGIPIKLTAAEGTTIYYTVDGKDPIQNTTGTSIYLNPLKIEEDTIIKAQAFKEGYNPTEVYTFQYEIIDSLILKKETDKECYQIGDLAEIKLKVENRMEDRSDVTLLVAQYDKNNRMLGYMKTKQLVESKGIIEVLNYTRVLEGATEINCYIIDSLENMKTLSNKIVIPVKELQINSEITQNLE